MCKCLVPKKGRAAGYGKQDSHGQMHPQCKVHGVNADHGAEHVLAAVHSAGFGGQVCTQFPLYSETTKSQSRSLPSMSKKRKSVPKQLGGIFRAGPSLKLDMLLCSCDASGKHVYAAIEVHGHSHKDRREIHRDNIKAKAARARGLQVFAVDVTGVHVDTEARQMPDTALQLHTSAQEIVHHMSG